MKSSRVSFLKTCLLALSLVTLLGVGCAHDNRPLLIERYDSHDEAHLVKRIEQHITLDYWHHWKRSVYRHPDAGDLKRAGHDGVAIIDQLDKPEWVRGPFKSLEGQKIDEWLYIDQDRLFQFADGQLIFEGPVSDFERILLERGYPDKAESIIDDNNSRTDILIYRHPFWAEFEQFQLNDGYITQTQEGN